MVDQEITELPSDPMGGASGEKRRFRIDFLGKTNNADFPYTVANETVAAQIGLALGLHLPMVVPYRLRNDDCILIQMIDSDPEMKQGPPATAAALAKYVSDHPDEIHAAIVFDLYIANNDRAFGPERRNLKLDTNGRLLIYDNGNSCFYRHRRGAGIEAGIARLDAVESDMTALFDMDHKGSHYREFLSDWNLVRRWCERIRQLPDFVIEAAVSRIPPASATAAERERLLRFLVRRRGYLFDHIVAHRQKFTGLKGEPEVHNA